VATVTAANHAPNTPTAHSETVAPGVSTPLSTMFTNFTDPDTGDTITQFNVQDRTAGGGHLFHNGVQQADNTVFAGDRDQRPVELDRLSPAAPAA